jgi:hypothetical protein
MPDRIAYSQMTVERVLSKDAATPDRIRRTDDCTGASRSPPRLHCNSGDCSRRRCCWRPEHVVRRRYRRAHGSHRDAANFARQGLEGRGACLGPSLAALAVTALALAANLAAAALLASTILFYVVLYKAWLKRATQQNIVIGGAAGALPPVIGWAAATGQAGLEPLVLFPYYLPLDTTPFLGPRAQPHR